VEHKGVFGSRAETRSWRRLTDSWRSVKVTVSLTHNTTSQRARHSVTYLL